MGAVMTYRRAGKPFILGALLKQFVHDQRSEIHYSAGWQHFTNAGGSFRSGDVSVSSGQPQDIDFAFSFTATGRTDEWVSLHGSLDNRCAYRVQLNGTLIAERNTVDGDVSYSPIVSFQGGGAFYTGSGNFYENPFLVFQPVAGLNALKITKVGVTDNDNRNFFFDGLGLNVRGVPQP